MCYRMRLDVTCVAYVTYVHVREQPAVRPLLRLRRGGEQPLVLQHCTVTPPVTPTPVTCGAVASSPSCCSAMAK